MKILSLILFFVCLFVVGGYGQTKKVPAKPQSISAIRISTKLILLQKQKREVEEKLKALKSHYKLEHPPIKETQIQLDNINQQISDLSNLEPSSDDLDIFEADINTNELLKILIVQNQRIIELLEKRTSPK